MIMYTCIQIAFVITDGKQTKDRGSYEELDVASKDLKAAGVQVYAMGIGRSVDRKELEAMASDPDFVLLVDGFGDLQDIVNGIKTDVCKG